MNIAEAIASALTQALKQALALVDVRVLDHFVVAGSGVVSFAERGLLWPIIKTAFFGQSKQIVDKTQL